MITDTCSAEAPCRNCICVPMCKYSRTFDLLQKCSLVKEFYYIGYPFHQYTRYMDIRRAFELDLHSVEMHKDWQHTWCRCTEDIFDDIKDKK